MKLLIEPEVIAENINNCDGVILSLENYSVQSSTYYSFEDIKFVKDKYSNLEVFVSMNKTFLNDELDSLKDMLIKLNDLGVNGIFFYDFALIKLKKDLGLSVDLVWNQPHMVNNYKTCDYYYGKDVKYALIGKEITLEEILEISNKSKIDTMVEVVSMPSVAFSRRKLITNYYKDLGKEGTDNLTVLEKVSNSNYQLLENKYGTSFFLKDIMNGTSVIKDLYENNVKYIIMREFGIDKDVFNNLVIDTKNYISNDCSDETFVSKYKDILGENTNFFFKKTIYVVKKNG